MKPEVRYLFYGQLHRAFLTLIETETSYVYISYNINEIDLRSTKYKYIALHFRQLKSGSYF